MQDEQYMQTHVVYNAWIVLWHSAIFTQICDLNKFVYKRVFICNNTHDYIIEIIGAYAFWFV